MLREKLIAFANRIISGRARGLSTYEKKLIIIVEVIRKWRPYLLESWFTIKTDHSNLKDLLEQQITTTTQEKWLIKLIHYEVIYKHDKVIVATGALSRKYEEVAEC